MFLNDSLSVLIGLPLICNPLFYVSHFISQNYKLQSHFYPARFHSANSIFLKKKAASSVQTPPGHPFRGAGAAGLSQPSVCWVHGGALCVGVQGRSRQQPALSTSGTRDASVTHLPALTAGQLGSTFTLCTSNPRHASQTGRAFTPWLSAAAFLNIHGRAPGHSDSLGQGHQTGTITRELALQFRCSLVVLLVYRRRFTHSNLVHVGGGAAPRRGFACGQTDAGSAVNRARVSVRCPSSGGFGARSRGLLRGNV